MALLLSPNLEEVVSEQLKLSLQSGVVLSHGCDVLLKSLDFSFGLLGQMELENFDTQLHLEVVV